MAYVVTDNCIRCKFTDCVEVCPVDCFRAGANMLVIDPDSCIDCGVCALECPAEAIKPESESLLDWLEFNKKYAKEWPIIVGATAPMPDAEKYNGEENKLAKYFDPKPGKGS